MCHHLAPMSNDYKEIIKKRVREMPKMFSNTMKIRTKCKVFTRGPLQIGISSLRKFTSILLHSMDNDIPIDRQTSNS